MVASVQRTFRVGRMMKTALVIPSLGAPSLDACLQAVEQLHPAPDEVLLVLSGERSGTLPTRGFPALRFDHRLGFAAAANSGITAVWRRADAVGLLNDDALPHTSWLGRLAAALDSNPGLAAVQGTVTDGTGDAVDGRGILINRWGLPEQVDRGIEAVAGAKSPVNRTAVSATAALFRTQALRATALAGGAVFDPLFGSYHEDVDLGLRLLRLGWRSQWVPNARCRHLGSSTGVRLSWRHPWWLLANPWRVAAGNLRPWATLRLLPRTAWGELRALPRLSRQNPRAPLASVAVILALPAMIASGWRRVTPGERLKNLPLGTS